MERLVVECLRCGHQRAIVPGPRRYQGAGECPRCRYVGWADSAELNERMRGLYRSVPPDHRVQPRVLERLGG